MSDYEIRKQKMRERYANDPVFREKQNPVTRAAMMLRVAG